jgi:hypothetical protein
MPVKFSYEQIVEAAQKDEIPVTSAALQDDIMSKLGFSMLDANGQPQAFRGILLTEIKRIFDKYENKDHWKNAFNASVPASEVSALLAGIEYYQGAQGQVLGSKGMMVTVWSPGYQC